jgi:hypothetical protein
MRLSQYWAWWWALWKDHSQCCAQGMTCRSRLQFLAGTPVPFMLQNPERLWCQFKRLFNNYNRILFPWLKRSEHEPDHSLPPSPEIKNGWKWKYNYFSTAFPQSVQWDNVLLRLLTAVTPEATYYLKMKRTMQKELVQISAVVNCGNWL